MDDFAYLVPDSATAWLAGRGDGRFERYERFYRAEQDRHAENFDLETANDEYGNANATEPNPVWTIINAPWVGSIVVVFFCVYMGSQLVPALTTVAPKATSVGLLVAFFGLRIFHRRRRRPR